MYPNQRTLAKESNWDSLRWNMFQVLGLDTARSPALEDLKLGSWGDVSTEGKTLCKTREWGKMTCDDLRGSTILILYEMPVIKWVVHCTALCSLAGCLSCRVRPHQKRADTERGTGDTPAVIGAWDRVFTPDNRYLDYTPALLYLIKILSPQLAQGSKKKTNALTVLFPGDRRIIFYVYIRLY